MVYRTMDLDYNAEMIVCDSNCIVTNFTGKECDVAPYTDVYETIDALPIVQAATAYENNYTG